MHQLCCICQQEIELLQLLPGHQSWISAKESWSNSGSHQCSPAEFWAFPLQATAHPRDVCPLITCTNPHSQSPSPSFFFLLAGNTSSSFPYFAQTESTLETANINMATCEALSLLFHHGGETAVLESPEVLGLESYEMELRCKNTHPQKLQYSGRKGYWRQTDS